MICAIPFTDTPANAALSATRFLAELRCRTQLGRVDAFRAQVEDAGGTFMLPQPGNTMSSHLVEVQLYGISAYGDTAVAAVDNWMRAAARATTLPEPDSPPFDAPRNHAEEIENLRHAMGWL